METAILLRESMFLNGILTNAEIWYSLTKEEIKQLEDLDLTLLRKLLNVPYSTPSEAFYLELGILPIGVIIKAWFLPAEILQKIGVIGMIFHGGLFTLQKLLKIWKLIKTKRLLK